MTSARRFPTLHSLLVALLLLGGASAPQVWAQRGPPSAPVSTGLDMADTSIGLRLKLREGRNGSQVVISEIRPGTRAASLGLKPGGVLTHVLDQPVANVDEACTLIENWAANPEGPLSLVIDSGRTKGRVMIFPTDSTGRRSPGAVRPAPPGRGDQTTEQAIAAKRQSLRDRRGGGARGGAATLAHTEVTDPLLIPGLASRPTAPAGINVLRRVFIDPQSGQLAFAGYYDPAYATGPIDYSTLLADALHSPRPSFSLEATRESKAASAAFVRQFDQQMQRNLGSVEAGKAWFTGIFDQLLTNPALEVDRRRFLARGAEIFGVQPAEVPPFVQAMLGRTEMGSPPWVDFWARFYQRAGAPEAAAYIRAAANKDNDNAAFQAALDGLGVRPLITELRAGMQSGAISQPAAYARLEVAIWAAIYRRCGIPDSRWRAAGDRAGQTGDTTQFRTVIDAINAEMVTERVIDAWLNGLVLSENFLQVMNQMPPLSVAPICSDGLASDSELARTFLAADWTLKNLGVTPELAQKVPGHRTPSQFSFELETARGIHDLGDVNARMWLQPAGVELRHDPAGAVVDFGRANIAVHASVIAHGRSGSAAAQQLARDAVNGYAAELTRRYDEYARALPDLHRLREAAKVIALVQWAGARGVRLVPPTAAASPGPLPASFQRGFWTGNFYANPEKTFFGLVAIGGVDFGPEVGGGWVQTGVDPALKSSALGQLVGSAALGREAADAALRGDLESARALADQSARAMTGDFDFTGHPALPQIPEASPPSPVDQALLQDELLQQSRKAIATLAEARQTLQSAGGDSTLRDQATGRQSQAESRLQQVRDLLGRSTKEPGQARQWVALLRNGDWDSLPKPVVAQAAPPPAAPKPVVDPAERARIRGEITQLRTELCRIQTQLRRFNATVQADQDQRAEWEKVTNDAYESALSRAKEKLEEFSVDFPGDILKEKLEKATDPAERAKIERALRLVDRLKDAYTTRDFGDWAAHEDYTREEVIEGIKQIAEICEVEDRIKDYLSKRWGLKRVIAFAEAADDLVTSAYDVTAEVVAWRRLRQLNQNSEDFLRATEASGRRLRELIAAIHEREVRLGLDPGSTKEPCAQ